MTNPNKLADALRKAFDLGQRYWMLADSESYSDNRKSVDVLERFDTLKREALAEHDAQPAQGEWAWVPREPTEAMIDEGMRSIRCDLELGRKPQERSANRAARNAYVTMLAAAPQPAPAPVQAACRCLECGAETGEPCAEECTHPPAPAADGAGELPQIAMSEAAEVLRGMGYRWVNATWAPYLPDVAPGSGSGDGAHNRLAAIAALRQPVADAVWHVPPLDDDSRWILGRPNFACMGVANALRKLGHAIPPKAEEEQAASIHWMLGMLAKHGSQWRAAAEIELRKSEALASQQESRDA